MRLFGYFSKWIHLLRLTLEICCLTQGAQMDFVTEAMLCKVFRPGDGKPIIALELRHISKRQKNLQMLFKIARSSDKIVKSATLCSHTARRPMKQKTLLDDTHTNNADWKKKKKCARLTSINRNWERMSKRYLDLIVVMRCSLGVVVSDGKHQRHYILKAQRVV